MALAQLSGGVLDWPFRMLSRVTSIYAPGMRCCRTLSVHEQHEFLSRFRSHHHPASTMYFLPASKLAKTGTGGDGIRHGSGKNWNELEIEILGFTASLWIM